MQDKMIHKAMLIALGILIVLGITAIWHGLIAMPLEPQWKNWIPYPSLAENYRLYSIITFSTSGALLFRSGFYRWLYGAIGGGDAYRVVKYLVWGCLIGITVVIAYAVTWVLNLVVNLAYGGLIVGLLLLPTALGVMLLVVIHRAKSSVKCID